MAAITQARLKELLNYDPETGIFTWRVNRRATQGSKAGARHPTQGYIAIKIDSVLYRAHRLAWLYVYGVWPPNDIDHINRVRDDNRLSNLRLATRAQNCQNRRIRSDNVTGTTGVCRYKKTQKWRAYIMIRKRQKELGVYDSLAAAILSRKIAEKVYFTHGIC